MRLELGLDVKVFHFFVCFTLFFCEILMQKALYTLPQILGPSRGPWTHVYLFFDNLLVVVLQFFFLEVLLTATKCIEFLINKCLTSSS